MQEEVQPVLLGLLKGVVLSLSYTFNTEVLHRVLQKMPQDRRVEGPMSEAVGQYRVPFTESEGEKTLRLHTFGTISQKHFWHTF